MQDLQRLIALFQAGRTTEAIVLGETMLRAGATDAAIYNVLAAAYAQMRRSDKALEYYAALARLEPNNADAHNNLGIALSQVGQAGEAAQSFRRAADADPRFAEALNNLGFTLGALGRDEEAIQTLARAVAVKPRYPEAHNNLGVIAARLGRSEEAIKSYQTALRQKPDYAQAHNNLGNVLWRLGRREEATASFERALKFNPELADANNGLGNALFERGDIEDAIARYKKALALNPNSVDALNNLGLALRKQGANEEALGYFTRALKLKPDFIAAWNNLGATLVDMREFEKAVEVHGRALQVDPNSPDTHNKLGNALSELGRIEEALASYNRAGVLDPGSAGVQNNIGLALLTSGRAEEALAAFTRATELQPDFADAHLSRGVALAYLRQPAEAIDAFSRALAIQPSQALARAQRLLQQALICDWEGMAQDAAEIPALGVSGGVVPPFARLSLVDDPAAQRICAERFVAERYLAPPPKQPPPPTQYLPKRPQKLRIGYFSGDVRDHAVMYLIARVLELHDRERFAVHMYSYGPDRADATRTRIMRAVDAFHDIRSTRDASVVELARSEGIDIAVDLTGHTQRSRSALFAQRLAPVQINFLGYPGTIGLPAIDYIVADKIIIPEAARAHYTEQPIYMPHAYQANDDTRPIAEKSITRAEAGLPDTGFVFCSFNNSYKVTPAEFDIWMRLLASNEGSVLWLLKPDDLAVENLRRAARARGIEPERIVFAPGLALADHLARHQLGDLFLDTFTYNAHTTASDALWAGLPVVTKIGRGFAARVAASLVTAVGLPELITESEEAYFDLADRLAKDPAMLDALKRKLAGNRLSAPLFNSALFARHLEQGFDAAYQLYLDGRGPMAIHVPTHVEP